MDKLIDQYIDQLIELSSDSKFIWNIEKIKSNKPMTWNYIDGCLFTSFIEIYKLTQNQKYLDFVKKCIDSFVDENGEIATYEINNHNLDDICESRVLFFLHKHFGEEKYLKAIEKTFEQIKNQPRTYEGSFWHKDIYQRIVPVYCKL